MKITISGKVKESITDGKGIRYSLFMQGCPHHCEGCHNPETWSMDGGEEVTVKEIFDEFRKNPLLKGITFSGGEPMCQPKPLIELAKMVHSIGKDVTVFSGWTYEELREMNDEDINALLDEIDVLVDGRFILEQKNLDLSFRGSENQRVIDMNKTRESGKVVLLDLD